MTAIFVLWIRILIFESSTRLDCIFFNYYFFKDAKGFDGRWRLGRLWRWAARALCPTSGRCAAQGGQLRGNNLTWIQRRVELFLKWQRTCIRVFLLLFLFIIVLRLRLCNEDFYILLGYLYNINIGSFFVIIGWIYDSCKLRGYYFIEVLTVEVSRTIRKRGEAARSNNMFYII